MQFSNRKSALVWDWNGTLLNDLDICLECMNQLLSARKLPLLSNDRYRDIFTFPVRDYYLKAGFDFSKEPFELPATEFIQLYLNRLPDAQLYPTANKILRHFAGRGYFQALLSAMEETTLNNTLVSKGVDSYFQLIGGINNHYADGKLEAGKHLLEKMEFKNEEILLVGDSLHDLEVAEKLGLEVILIAHGHQSKRRLLEKTPHVVDDLPALLGILDQTFPVE